MEKVKYPYLWDIERLICLAENANIESHYNIIDILEFSNVLKFLINNTYSHTLSEQQIKTAKANINQIITLYFENRTQKDLIEDFKYMFDSNNVDQMDGQMKDTSLEIDSDKKDILNYREDYLECFEKFKLAQLINESSLESAIQNMELPIWLFLKTNYFIQNYPQIMKSLFLKRTGNFEILLDNYTNDYLGNKEKSHIPTNITKEEMYQFCIDYIKNDPNINYLGLLEQGIQGIKELNIDGKLKLKAKRKKEEIEKKIFYNEDGTFTSNSLSRKIAVYTNKKEYEKEDLDFKVFIDLDWIKENSEPETLLNSLLYLEYFFTSNWILNLCSFPNLEAPTLERLFGIKSQKHYETSIYFSNKNDLILLSFKVFDLFLKKELNTRVENLISHFFTKYSEKYFNVSWLSLDFAKSDEKMSIQTKNLFTVEEHIRKQWKLLVEEIKIDKDLFELENTPRINALESLLDKKYIYINPKNKEINRILNLLFSDQSSINYINENLDYVHIIV